MSIRSLLLVIFLPCLGVSLFLLLFSLLSKRFPSKYGSNTGYNTPTSRKCEEAWNYAQQIFPRYCARAALVIFVMSLIICAIIFAVEAYIFHSYEILNEQLSVNWSLILLEGSLGLIFIVMAILLFLPVELKLRAMLKEMNNKKSE